MIIHVSCLQHALPCWVTSVRAPICRSCFEGQTCSPPCCALQSQSFHCSRSSGGGHHTSMSYVFCAMTDSCLAGLGVRSRQIPCRRKLAYPGPHFDDLQTGMPHGCHTTVNVDSEKKRSDLLGTDGERLEPDQCFMRRMQTAARYITCWTIQVQTSCNKR